MSCIAHLGAAFMQSQAAQGAANTQASAAEYAANLMFKEFGITQQNLMPFIQGGQKSMGALESLMGIGPGGKGFLNSPLGARFNPTMAQLSQTPGYQFALTQGEQAVENQAASQGLGKSGAEMKGAANYAEGLASTTYQQQFENYLQQQQQEFGMLSGTAQTGAGAASSLGQIGTSQMANIGNSITGAAAAEAAGQVGSANAWSNALYGANNNMQQMMMMAMMSNGMFGAGGGAGGMYALGG